MKNKKRERALLRVAEHNRLANETRDDHTRQREFERSFESRDLPFSRAAIADMSDGGRCVARTIARLDSIANRAERERLINDAAAKLPRKTPMLTKLLWAIYRNGSNRQATMAELGISPPTYRGGLKFLLKFFSAL